MKNDTIINLIKWFMEREINVHLHGAIRGETVSITPLFHARAGIDCSVTYFSERFMVSLDPRKSFESAANIVIKVCGAKGAYQQLIELKEKNGGSGGD